MPLGLGELFALFTLKFINSAAKNGQTARAGRPFALLPVEIFKLPAK
jgi:hypothetical protein